MEITEAKVVLKEGPDKKLKAYATITFDNCFVVRNIKVIRGNKGLFVAMPSRKLREACQKCHAKNPVRSRYCSQCGASLPVASPKPSPDGVKQSEHRDIAHPITLECREYIQKKVLDAYEEELNKTGMPQERETQAPERPPAPAPSAAPPVAPPVDDEVDDSGDIEL